MPYKHPIPDAPIAPSMLPRVPAAKLTLQDILVLTQPGNNPGQKNKSLELGTLFEAVKSSLPKDMLLVDNQDEYPSHYLISKFKGNSASSYLDNGDVGFCVVSRKGARYIAGVIENQVVTTDKLADDAVKPGTTACLQTKKYREEEHVCAACACIYMEDYLSVDYLDNIKECQCKKVPNPFYVVGAVTEEMTGDRA